jgi:hypothetical protein
MTMTTEPINWGGIPGPYALSPRHFWDKEIAIYAGQRCLIEVDYDDMGEDEMAMAEATARAAALIPEIVMALRRMIPRNVCLTNRNIPDSQILPMDVEVGELRAIAALLSEIDGEGGR